MLFVKGAIDFGIKPFKKGFVGVERAKAQHSPPLAGETEIYSFSRLKNVPVFVVLRSKTQNIVLKKSFQCRKCVPGGALSCRAPPHPTQSALRLLRNRKCVSFTVGVEGFGSCEKGWESNQGANEVLCPFNPHEPFKKGSILNFYDFLFRQIFHSRGSFGGFQAPQRALENTGRSDR